MRITNKIITNNYLSNLNANLEYLNNISERLASGRSYLKGSDDPETALKAYQVRENLSRISLYQDNITEANTIMTDVESAVSELNSIMTSIKEQVIQGESDTCSSDDRAIIAEVLQSYQAEILDVANSKSSGKYIFGGSDMNTIPFCLEGDTLLYHGVDVDSSTGFSDESLYYDIGLGLELDGSGQVMAGTGLDIANPGSELFGTGTDANGIANNVYNLVGEIAQMFQNNDLSNLDTYVSKLEEVSDSITVKYASIGQKTSFIDFVSERLESNKANATVKQTELEGIDTAAGALEYSTQEAAYEAALAVGSKILQYSLLDYMS